MRSLGWVSVLLVLASCDASGSPGATGTDTDAGSTAMTTGTTGAADSTGGGASFEQTLACQSWLACLDADAQAQLEDQYGPQGSCWTQTAAVVEACDADCVAGYDAECVGGSQSGGGEEGGSSGGPDVEACALDVLAPGADSWVEAGDEPALIPTEIGAVLERVCSCHVADLEAFVEDAPLYYGNARFYTYAQMHAPFEGAPMYVEVGIRALEELNMPPVYYCGEADFGSLDADEHAILEAWISAEAPDGAQWLRVRPDGLPTLD